jgi:hypothetical protein
MQCTNGMSNSRRNARFANAGIVVSVSLADFARAGFRGPLAGLEFQRHWEREAYQLGGGRFFAPAQSIPDYLQRRLGKPPGDTSYRPGLMHTDLNRLFPPELTEAIHAALRRFEQRMRGFPQRRGQEAHRHRSRTSSPVRLPRGEDLQSVSLSGLYPSGEGCGYAGGIVSSRHRRTAHRRADRPGAGVTYRVRSPRARWTSPPSTKVAKALRQGLVDADDQLFAPGADPVRVGDHPALKGHLPKPSRLTLGAGGLELGATVAAGLAAITGILSGWNHWVVGGCVAIVAWLSTRVALRVARRKSSRGVDSGKR